MTRSSLLISCLLVCVVRAEYQPNWGSLDSRPLPSWYDEAKVGIFLHWGVFSVPSFGSAWFWKFWRDDKNQAYVNFMKNNYRPDFTYQDFARDFTAEFYDPEEWARILDASGARYVVLTSKHHEGFTLWPSKGSWGWNAMDVGPKRDLVGDLAAAVRSQAPHIHFGLYHSLYEWFNPFFLQDKDNNFHTNEFVTRKTMPELYELVNNYHPAVVWSDGAADAADWYWNSTVFLAWLFNESPVKDTVVVNDRWGLGTSCHHGSFYTCKDRYNPGVLQPHKWENCMTLDKKAWVFRRNAPATDYLTIHELLAQLASTISCGDRHCNILINAGPTHDGRIPAIMEERLRQLGWWLGVNGQAVYESKPWTHQNDSLTPGVWYTQKEGTVYAIVLTWPPGDVLVLGSVRPSAVPILFTHISMLGYQGALQFKAVKRGLQVVFPRMSEVDGQWAWVLSMRGVYPATNHIASVAE